MNHVFVWMVYSLDDMKNEKTKHSSRMELEDDSTSDDEPDASDYTEGEGVTEDRKSGRQRYLSEEEEEEEEKKPWSKETPLDLKTVKACTVRRSQLHP